MTDKYDALAARAERGELTVKPGSVRRGDASRAEAQRALLEATGAESVQEAMELTAGRPKVGSEEGASPIVRARVPKELKTRVSELAKKENRNESEIVREALAAYMEMRHAS